MITTYVLLSVDITMQGNRENNFLSPRFKEEWANSKLALHPSPDSGAAQRRDIEALIAIF